MLLLRRMLFELNVMCFILFELNVMCFILFELMVMVMCAMMGAGLL